MNLLISIVCGCLEINFFLYKINDEFVSWKMIGFSHLCLPFTHLIAGVICFNHKRSALVTMFSLLQPSTSRKRKSVDPGGAAVTPKRSKATAASAAASSSKKKKTPGSSAAGEKKAAASSSRGKAAAGARKRATPKKPAKSVAQSSAVIDCKSNTLSYVT